VDSFKILITEISNEEAVRALAERALKLAGKTGC
jgi:hypothetical protein